MTRTCLSILALAAAALLLPAAPASAAESEDACTGLITSLPHTIAAPGVWCLGNDVAMAAASGIAIAINASNVTLDCNDHRIDGTASGAATASIGVSATNRLNARVRRCNVLGFQQGIRLTGTGGGHVVEDNRIDSATFVGIQLAGDGSVIRRNHIIDIGGSTTKVAAYGIYATGAIDVLDNTVAGATATAGGNASAFGIYSNLDVGGSINRNRVRDVVHAGTGTTYGIFTAGATRMTLRDNEVSGAGIAGSIGIRCAATGNRVRGASVSGYATSLSGCGDAGGNDLY